MRRFDFRFRLRWRPISTALKPLVWATIDATALLVGRSIGERILTTTGENSTIGCLRITFFMGEEGWQKIRLFDGLPEIESRKSTVYLNCEWSPKTSEDQRFSLHWWGDIFVMRGIVFGISFRFWLESLRGWSGRSRWHVSHDTSFISKWEWAGLLDIKRVIKNSPSSWDGID